MVRAGDRGQDGGQGQEQRDDRRASRDVWTHCMLVAPAVWLWPASISAVSPVAIRPRFQEHLALRDHLVRGVRELGLYRQHPTTGKRR